LPEDESSDGDEPDAMATDENPRRAGSEDVEERVNGEEMASADVHVGGHGDQEVEGWREGKVKNFSAPLHGADDHENECQQKQHQERQRRFDGEGFREIEPVAVGINVSIEVTGVGVGGDFGVGEAVQPGLRHQVEAAEEREGLSGAVIGEKGKVGGESGMEGEPGGTGGVAESVKGPNDEPGEDTGEG
jgi:hypothetical protein